jgi:hypothetical protein
MTRLTIALAASALAGCASTGNGEGGGGAARDAVAEAPTTCNAAAAQSHIGHDATQGMAAAILKDSSARTFRWGPPNGAWTMDYRQDRVNVRYDASMKITEITCG